MSNPVERFIREVIPTIPGGPLRIRESRGHLRLIRDAAAARGLSTRSIAETTYFYDGRQPVGGMRRWTPTLVGSAALAACQSKAVTKQMLEAAGVPTPSGIALDVNGLDTAIAHLRTMPGPAVLKPSTAKGGVGITCGIQTESDLRAAWEVAWDATQPVPQVVLEEQVDGIDVRAYVVGHRVAAAATRINTHVVGDGRRTITELIEVKHEWRRDHVLLGNRPFVVETALLERRGRTVHDVPAADEVVVLNSISNLHVGGENVDVTDLLHPDLKDLAVGATRAIPGLGVAGVDLLVRDLDSLDGAVVLEANVQANIKMHHCPAYGRPRDVAGAIIDEMIATAGSPPRETTAAPRGRPARRMARSARRRG